MGAVAEFAIDTSALARINSAPVADALNRIIVAGLVSTCAVLDFEHLFSARSPKDFRSLQAIRRGSFEYLPTDERDWERALEVQERLSELGRLREVGMADLVIAAVAERHRVALLHYHSDFDTIASITGQDVRWVVPRGSVD